ncbi:cytochrome P450 4C1-like isoform X2 [Epargyreus clarus]|uniref:cytochrome P450 4C1-like isoform X2 n=1 Tax=Epargyreus clarus TaxID=520877 RepID=UPI003C2F60CD
MAYWLAAILLTLLVVCLHLRYSRAGRLIAKIPGHKALPILGNAYVVIQPTDKLFVFLREMYKTFGGITILYAFTERAVNIYEPDDVEKILSTTQFNDKKEPYTFLKSWLGNGLVISNGSMWQHRRKMITPAFHFNILKKYTQTFTEQTEDFLKTVKEESGKEQTNLIPLISRVTLHIIAETAMGISMGEGKEAVVTRYLNALHTVGDTVVKRLCRVWYFIDMLFNMSELGKTQRKALKDLHALTDQVIRERKQYLEDNNVSDFNEDCEVYGKRGRLAMLDLLLQNLRERKIDDKGVREEVDTFMFGENIYDEMNKIFGSSQRPPTMNDLNDMKYLECCIKESLRIYPSVPGIARNLETEVVLSGYHVPANTAVNIHIYDIHHRADIYPDPEFIPERFLPENALKRHPYAYIPFSAGPRNCLGQKFAMLEMKTMLSGLLRRFKIEAVTKSEEITFATHLVLRSTHPIYVRFRERH